LEDEVGGGGMSGTVKLTEIMREKDRRIAELEAELDKCKMRTLSPEADMLVSEYTTKYKALEAENQQLQGENESLLVERRRLEAELAHANIESVDLENENQRLRDALEHCEYFLTQVDPVHWPSKQEAREAIAIAKQALENET